MSNKFTFNIKEKAHQNTVIQIWGGGEQAIRIN